MFLLSRRMSEKALKLDKEFEKEFEIEREFMKKNFINPSNQSIYT